MEHKDIAIGFARFILERRKELKYKNAVPTDQLFEYYMEKIYNRAKGYMALKD